VRNPLELPHPVESPSFSITVMATLAEKRITAKRFR
jgi:hypothetical protein